MLRAGEELHGRYRIERTLGQGGMGGVYLAMHLELEVPVAVKELVFKLADPSEHAAAIKQFRSEAQMLHRLHHPHLPRVYDFFETGGAHFLVMDYVDGHTLEQELRARGPLPEEEVRRIGLSILDVLGYMHSQKPPVIFRDLKPPNIMLDRDRNVKLIDFGIAKLIEDHGGKTSTIIRAAGTPGFAAPEQYGAGTDERSDIYSLGATLYCLLTGKVPPPSPALAVDAAQLIRLTELRPDISTQLLATVNRMMETSPARRPRSTREVEALLNGLPLPFEGRFPEPPFPPPPGSSEEMPPTVPLGGLRLSGDTQDLAGSARFSLRYDDAPPQGGFTGFMGDVRRPQFSPSPGYLSAPTPVLPEPPPARPAPPAPVDPSVVPAARPRPAAESESEGWHWPTLGDLPAEVTVPVLVGVVAAIFFLIVLAAFLRGRDLQRKQPSQSHLVPVACVGERRPLIMYVSECLRRGRAGEAPALQS